MHGITAKVAILRRWSHKVFRFNERPYYTSMNIYVSGNKWFKPARSIIKATANPLQTLTTGSETWFSIPTLPSVTPITKAPHKAGMCAKENTQASIVLRVIINITWNPIPSQGLPVSYSKDRVQEIKFYGTHHHQVVQLQYRQKPQVIKVHPWGTKFNRWHVDFCLVGKPAKHMKLFGGWYFFWILEYLPSALVLMQS